MYLAAVRIQNFRCFIDQVVDFTPGVNVLLGENNAGKTTIIKALGLVLDQRARRRPTFYDFHQPSEDWTAPPSITVTITFRSSKSDKPEDKALVATWLTKLESPWEAQLTYTFSLDPEHEIECRKALAAVPARDFDQYQQVVESHLDKYVTKTFGGAVENQLEAERDSLDKITFHSLDAVRDAPKELFTGTDPLLKRILKQIRDEDKTAEEIAQSTRELRKLTQDLGIHIRNRIRLEALLRFVNDTGALEGGAPQLANNLREEDLLYALRMYVESSGALVPAELNGLGYNNLLYISLVLASLDHQADPSKRGSNASIFPILSIEEPEAHLHPALQYKLLRHIEKRVRETKRNRQVFITTHSTHITSASALDQLIVCTLPTTSGSPRIAYPGKCFKSDREGRTSKAYVERYLDATKSSLLFAKGVIFVEGIAEQLLLPVLAEHIECSLEEHHVALIPVGGLTFKHFLPLFGAGLPPGQAEYALARPVACLIDADPSKKSTDTNEQFHSCYPYEINQDPKYTYRPLSDSIEKLEALKTGRENILVEHGVKTLEYDLALDNHMCPFIVTDACTHAVALRTFIAYPATTPYGLAENLKKARAATDHLPAESQVAHVVATCYLKCLDSAKGEHAFALARVLKVLLRFQTRKSHWGEKALASARAAKDGKEKPGIADFKVPRAIASVIRWASRQPAPTTPPPA